MRSVLTISGAREFANHIFHYFNGKINTIPVPYLIFSGSSHETSLGLSIGDIIVINIDNIYRYAQKENQLNEDAVEGIILYVIIHELLHVSQDGLKYMEEFSQYDQDTIQTLIEHSCHAKTFLYIKELYQMGILPGEIIDRPNIKIPSFCNFTDFKYDSNLDSIIQQYANSFYMITNPLRKVFEILSYIQDFDLSKFPQENPQVRYIILEIVDNKRIIASDYIFFNGNWMPYWYIMNMLRPCVLEIERKSTILESDTDYYIHTENPCLVKFVITLKEDILKHVVEK